MIKILVEAVDVSDIPCDVLVLKYAQGFYGADAFIAATLEQAKGGKLKIDPKPGRHVIFPSKGSIIPDQVLFLGVVPLSSFDYSEIRAFAKRALIVAKSELPEASHLAMTIHGVNYGLDEREAFLAQLGGIMDAEKSELFFKESALSKKMDAARLVCRRSFASFCRKQCTRTNRKSLPHPLSA